MKIKKSKKAIAALVVSSLFTVSPSAFAVEPVPDSEMNPVVVSAAKPEKEKTTPGYDRLAVPESSKAATEIITRKEIEAMHPKDVMELIESGSGIIGMRWGNKGYYKVETRGGDSVGFIIDGVYFPETQASRVIANLPVDIIESITFVRDASILTMGPVASIASNFGKGGAPNQGYIIIKTLKATKSIDQAKISYGTFDTEKLSLVHGDQINDTAYYTMGYAKDRSDGKSGWNNGRNFDTYFLKVGDKGPDWFADMTLMVNRGRNDQQAWFDANGNYMNLSNIGKWDPINTTLFTTNAAKQWNEHNTTSFSFGYSSVQATRVTLKTGKGIEENEYLRELNLMHTLNFGRDTLKFGTQAIWWHSPTGLQGTADYERQEELYGTYLYGERQVNNKLTLDAGARLDKKHITKGVAKYFNNGSGSGIAYDNSYGELWEGDSTSFSLGAAYQLDSVYKLSSRLGYSRQPAGKYLLTKNNELLDPEERYKYEAGVVANYNKMLNASLTAFYYDINEARVTAGTYKDADNNITSIYTGKDLARKGFELAFNGNLSDQLGYKCGYSYFTSSNALDDSQSPHNRYNLALNYKNKDFAANIMLLHVSKFAGTTNANNLSDTWTTSGTIGGYTTIDANISKELDKNTTLTLYGRNITDQRYVKGMNYYDSGAEYGIELSKKF